MKQRRKQILRVQKFNSATELNQLIMGLNTGSERGISVEGIGKTNKFKAIVNDDSDEVECVASSRYQLVQHREIFQPFVDTMQKLGVPLNGKLYDYGGSVSARVFFTGKEVTPADGKTIRLGIQMSNSLNLTRSIRMDLVAFRLVCSNGMVIGKAVPGCSYSRAHVGRAIVEYDVKKFLEKSIGRSNEFLDLVNQSIADTYEWELAKKALEKLILTKKHREPILKRIEAEVADRGGDKVTRWDIYNAVTNYLSVEESLTKSAIAYLEKKSQQLLAKPLVMEAEA
jgi:hypothetical protein